MSAVHTNKTLSTSLLQNDDFLILNQTSNKLEENSINNKNNTHCDDKYNERTSLLLFTLSQTFYGISNFQLKYINYLFDEAYDVFSFGIWRMIVFIFLVKQIIYYKKIEIIPLAKMNRETLFWLGVRSFGQFLSLVFFIGSMETLRVGTANCFVSMNPAAVLIFSAFFLKEKFHWRYPIGIAICFSGVLIIISNELNNTSKNRNNMIGDDDKNFGSILL